MGVNVLHSTSVVWDTSGGGSIFEANQKSQFQSVGGQSRVRKEPIEGRQSLARGKVLVTFSELLPAFACAFKLSLSNEYELESSFDNMLLSIVIDLKKESFA